MCEYQIGNEKNIVLIPKTEYGKSVLQQIGTYFKVIRYKDDAVIGGETNISWKNKIWWLGLI